MNKLIDSLKNKKFRYGAFSTLTAIFVIAILAVVNLVVDQLDLKYDLTVTKKYSISDTSKDFIRDLNVDVTIYALFKTGQEDLQFKEILEQYSANSSRIKIEYKDPYLYPQFVESYRTGDTEISVNSVIVESSKRSKVIPASDMATYTFNYETFQNDLTSIDIEPQVTNAIKYVTEESTPVIYTLTGHNEAALDSTLAKQLQMANFEIKELNMFDQESVPEDASFLFITTPARDWSPDEAEKIRAYLQNDGNAMFIVDYANVELPNLRSVLNTYGVDLGGTLVFEGSARNYFNNNPMYLLPNQTSHTITDSIIANRYPNLIMMSQGVKSLDVRKNSITIEPLLSTSNQAYGKTGASAQSLNKEPGDEDGPFNLAVAVTDSYYTDKQHYTRLVVIGTSSIMDPSVNSFVMGANGDLITNAASWLAGSESSMYVRAKSPSSGLSYLIIDGFQGLFIIVITVLVIPGCIIVAGIVVWLRRRNR